MLWILSARRKTLMTNLTYFERRRIQMEYAAAARVGMTLSRTQTRMQGADYCDFRYRAAEPD